MPTRASTNNDRPPSTLNWWTAKFRLVRSMGGAGSLARRAVNVFCNEGWSGLQRELSRFFAVSSRQAAAGNDYAAWAARYDTVTPALRGTLAAQANALPSQPLISIVMPVYNPQLDWLQDAIESVRGQIYENWELCVADDASTRVGVHDVLLRYQALDPRIKVAFRERNGHISAASNTALALAQGKWIALMDHDDLLTPHALYHIVEAINRLPDAQIVYSDEDKVDAAGERTAPHFKPDWNPELFLSYNYVCHLSAYRHALIGAVGGFREGYEGAQDYDLALRCTERVAATQIVHVPRVLYHWRLHAESTATGKSSKPYALPAGVRALNDHLVRTGQSAQAEERQGGAYRIRTTAIFRPTLTVILANKITGQGGMSVLSALQAATAYPFTETLQADGDLNRAVREARGDYVLIINAALRPCASDWLDQLMASLRQRGVGVVGPRIIDREGSQLGSALVLGLTGLAGVAHAGLASGDTGYFHRAVLTQAVSALSSHCLLIERALWTDVASRTQIGSWNSKASLDLCLQLHEIGRRSVYVADAVVQMSTTGAELSVSPTVGEETHTLLKTALDRGDVAYNPNLDLDRVGGFALAWPPRLESILDQPSHRPMQQPADERR